MSVLKSLKLVATKPNKILSTKDRGREKLNGFLDEQRALLVAQLEGKPFSLTKIVYRNNEAGQRVAAEVPRRVRPAWFVDVTGAAFLEVRYGSKPLELTKGMTAIQVENLDALPALIDSLKQAVAAGELDTVVVAAAIERRKNFKRKSAQA